MANMFYSPEGLGWGGFGCPGFSKAKAELSWRAKRRDRPLPDFILYGGNCWVPQYFRTLRSTLSFPNKFRYFFWLIRRIIGEIGNTSQWNLNYFSSNWPHFSFVLRTPIKSSVIQTSFMVVGILLFNLAVSFCFISKPLIDLRLVGKNTGTRRTLVDMINRQS